VAVGDEPIWEGEEVIERTIDPDGTVHERVVRRLARVDRAPDVGPDEPAAPRSIDLTDAVELEPSPSSVPDAATTSALRAAQDAVTPSPKQSWLANWKVVRSTTLDPAGAATSFRTTAMQVLEGEAEVVGVLGTNVLRPAEHLQSTELQWRTGETGPARWFAVSRVTELSTRKRQPRSLEVIGLVLDDSAVEDNALLLMGALGRTGSAASVVPARLERLVREVLSAWR
jgi:hypothetical protein